jgi:hypothetical protein
MGNINNSLILIHFCLPENESRNSNFHLFNFDTGGFMKLKKIVNCFWGKKVLRAPFTAIAILMAMSIVSKLQALFNQV